MSKLYFCSFADTSMQSALKRIRKQAKKLELFDNIKIYTQRNLAKYGKKRIKEIIKKTKSKRGYGYWAWKPIVINDVLNQMDYGDILLYSDAGTHLNSNGRTKLLKYIEDTKINDIWVIQLEAKHTDIIWAKKDLVTYFRTLIEDKDKLSKFDLSLNQGQLESGTILLIKNKYTVSLMNQWEQIMTIENCHLFDDSPSIQPNDLGFKENRHDQAVLSLLLKSNHYCSENTSHFFSETDEGWNLIRQTEPFLHKRDVPRKTKFQLKRLFKW